MTTANNLTSTFWPTGDCDMLSQQSQTSQASQEIYDKSDVPVRTKAAELIGRLTCVLWIYCNGMYISNIPNLIVLPMNKDSCTPTVPLKEIYVCIFAAFRCVLNCVNVDIPKFITKEYVRYAEAIVSKSYTHSELFSSVRNRSCEMKLSQIMS